MPRQLQRTFQENPETNTIKNKLADLSARYDKLKTHSNDHTNQLREVVDKQQVFHDQANDMDAWLKDAEKALNSAQKEKIGADPVAIEKQITALKV